MHAAMHPRIDMRILGFFAAITTASLFSARVVPVRVRMHLTATTYVTGREPVAYVIAVKCILYPAHLADSINMHALLSCIGVSLL